MKNKIWCAFGNDKDNTFIFADVCFEVVDEVGKRWAKEHSTTFYLREYVEEGLGFISKVEVPNVLREIAGILEEKGD